MRKLLFFFLIYACLLLETSCASAIGNESATTAYTDETTSETQTDEIYSFPKRDFDGEEFVFFSGFDNAPYISAEELIGEIVNDAYYNTEIACESMYSASIKTMISDEDSCAIADKNYQLFLAGDDTYNIVFANSVYLAPYQTAGIYKNLYDYDAFDFAKPWWPSYSVDAMTVGTQMYLGSNMISHTSFNDTRVIYANKDLLESEGIELPYDIVTEGKWTLDRLISTTKDIYYDVNGDGERDTTDTYGFIGSYWANSLALGADCGVLRKTGDDSMLTVDIDVDKMTKLVDKVYQWFFESDGTLVYYEPNKIFVTGSGYFTMGCLNDAVNLLRQSEIEYTMLPYPKYDEAQDGYRCYTQSFVFVIPNRDSDEDFEGCILETLACLRYQEVIPAYIETTLKGKIADMPRDAEMLDVIYDSITETFDRTYDCYHGLQIVLNVLIPEKNSNFTSWYAEQLPMAQKKVVELAEFYQKNEK